MCPKAFGEWGCPDHTELSTEVQPGSLTSRSLVPRCARVVLKIVKNHRRFGKLEKKIRKKTLFLAHYPWEKLFLSDSG